MLIVLRRCAPGEYGARWYTRRQVRRCFEHGQMVQRGCREVRALSSHMIAASAAPVALIATKPAQTVIMVPLVWSDARAAYADISAHTATRFSSW